MECAINTCFISETFSLPLCVATEDTISSGVKRMDQGITKIKAELKQHTKPQEWADKFTEKMKTFIAEGEGKFKKLRDQYQLMDKKFGELADYYCFDRKKMSMEEFFGDISQFCKDFEVRVLALLEVLRTLCLVQRARKENAKMREQIEKQRLAKEREVRTVLCVCVCVCVCVCYMCRFLNRRGQGKPRTTR